MSSNRCPFCQKANHCQVNSHRCWCMQQKQKIPSSLLELLPVNNLHKECICESCVMLYSADANAFKARLRGKNENNG